MVAVTAPPTASVSGGRLARRSARIATSPTPSRRMTKPRVPAVAGSMRRNRYGATKRPMSRANA
jgi:hypothetical protein